MNQSTPTTAPCKPEKPSPDYPLFAHATKRWAKKVDGKLLYFGPWHDPQGAFTRYQEFVATGIMPAPQAVLDKELLGKSKQPKPEKPYPEFPLFAHATGRWAKKIKGRLHYFGAWDDPQAALDCYLHVKDDLHAGRLPRPLEGELTLRDIVNHFLTNKRSLVDSNEITTRTWADYYSSCGRILAFMGKQRLVADLRGEDFARYRSRLAKKWGPVAVGNEIQRVRCLFKFAHDANLIEHPVRFGAGFKRPSKKTLRHERAKKGKRMFEANELRTALDGAGLPLKAMMLLGVNCGFGNSDVGQLTLKALDLEGGWVNFPRPKTGIERRCKLWPETVQALREWLPLCPVATDKQHNGLVFITRFGGPFHQKLGTERLSDKKITPSISDPVAQEISKLLTRLKMKRPGLNFYALRHSHETIAGESRDQVAVDYVMGHARDDMASLYRERISDERLEAVAKVVRDWLYACAAEDDKPDVLPMSKAN